MAEFEVQSITYDLKQHRVNAPIVRPDEENWVTISLNFTLPWKPRQDEKELERHAHEEMKLLLQAAAQSV